MMNQDQNNYMLPIAVTVAAWIWILGLVIFLT